MKGLNFSGLFKSEDSRYTLRTAFLVTTVPVLILAIIIYSIWLLVVFNHSYFIANGFPIDSQSLENFLYYILLTQIDYLPYLGLFFITVFFFGLFLAYVVLRPFNQIVQMCELLNDPSGKKVNMSGLNKQKVLVKIGLYFCDYYVAKKQNKAQPEFPKDMETIKSPTMDMVFYFQFICLIVILAGITTFSISMFTTQLHESIVQTAVTMLKAPKGLNIFLSSQEEIVNLIILVPSLMCCLFYAIIGRMIISRIEGVTYAYIRDIREVSQGNTSRRVSSRSDDPGRQAAEAMNKVLDTIHPKI